jgi:hypothetical protein
VSEVMTKDNLVTASEDTKSGAGGADPAGEQG